MDLESIFGFKGKNVFITGAGSGMGKAAGRLPAELGAEIYATVRNNPLDSPATKEIEADLSNRESAAFSRRKVGNLSSKAQFTNSNRCM